MKKKIQIKSEWVSWYNSKVVQKKKVAQTICRSDSFKKEIALNILVKNGWIWKKWKGVVNEFIAKYINAFIEWICIAHLQAVL